MPQFRVEFVADPASGHYVAEIYNPENPAELLMRTEALYPTQAAAVLGLVEFFRSALPAFARPSEGPRSRPKAPPRPSPRGKRPSAQGARRRQASRLAPRRRAASPTGRTSRAKARRR